jgi:hypothetical protein
MSYPVFLKIAVMPDSPYGDDPRPVPPVCPDNDECCNSGCNPCILDLYTEELNRYRAALLAWESRQQARDRRSED